jgi:hypothetical protein
MKFGVCITAAPAPAFLDHTEVIEIAKKAEEWMLPMLCYRSYPI